MFNLMKLLIFVLLMTTAPCVLAACSGSDKVPEPPRRVALEVNALFDDLAKLELAHSPETASQLGLSQQAVGYSYTGHLDDRSQAEWERMRLERLEALEALENVSLPPLGSRLRTDVDTVLAAYRANVDMAVFGHGFSGLGFTKPYVFDQLSGAYIDVPDLLTSRQPVRNAEEAGDYLKRLSQLADAITDERRRLESDARSGVSPPDFILEQMRLQADRVGAGPAETHILVTTLDNLMTGSEELDPEIRQRFMAEARRIVDTDILPTYQLLSETLGKLRDEAAVEPGVWVLPNGEAYYDTILNFYSGEETSAEDMHARGGKMVEDLTAELDAALIEIGLIEGSVGERLAALNITDGQLYENTPEGQAQLVADLNAVMQAMQARLREVVARPPVTSVTIARVPEFIEKTAPGGYYQSAASDGSSPGIFFINLRDTAEWPAYTLPTLVFHEAAPGHHVESAVSTETGELHIIRQMIWQSTYGEGWALYAEDLADEMGFYNEDPLGRIGYLQSVLFRAARVVADTGIHRMRWSREGAIDYLVAVTGQSRSAMATEVDRYAVWPGQAVSYMAGRERIRALRARARGVLRAEFDLAAFNYAILSGGPRPLDILERDIDAWVNAQLPDIE